jgi:hypothetical protein
MRTGGDGVNRVYVVTPRPQTTREIIDALLWGAEPEIYRAAIAEQGATDAAVDDMRNWCALDPEPWAYERETDAYIALANEPEGAEVAEVTLADIVDYYRERGWLS